MTGDDTRRRTTAVVVELGEHDGVAGRQVQLGGGRALIEGRARTCPGSRAPGRPSPDRARANDVASLAARRSSPIDTAHTSTPAARSSGPTFSWQLPNRSTHSTSACTPSASIARQRDHAGHQQVGVDERAEIGRGRRRCTGGRPPGRTRRDRRTWRRAPARWCSGLVSSTARSAPPMMATAGASRPLSGPTQHPGAAGDLDRERPPRCPDARVDDGQHDAVGARRGSPGPAPASHRARRTVGRRGSGRRPSRAAPGRGGPALTTPTNSSSRP